jgi:AcrR family transcriptional regulator
VLEAAILDAAWDQIREAGVAGFTFDAVAARAQTSKPVLYRRWSSRKELLAATLPRRILASPLVVPDLGSLREEVTRLLREGSEKRFEFISVFPSLGVALDGSSVSFAELRRLAIGGSQTTMDKILARARERGEMTVDLPERVAGLPFEMLRGQVLMTQKPLDAESIGVIVDEVFLPLVRAYEHGLDAGR